MPDFDDLVVKFDARSVPVDVLVLVTLEVFHNSI